MSPRSRRIASPTRIPVTASRPISVRIVAARCGVGITVAAHQRHDLGVGIEVRDNPSLPPRQQIGRRYLVHRVNRVQMSGEAAEDRQSMAVPVRSGRWWAGRPLKRQLAGDHPLIMLSHPRGELRQQLPRASELVSHRPPDRQILG
jgi:hypothetical protein